LPSDTSALADISKDPTLGSGKGLSTFTKKEEKMDESKIKQLIMDLQNKKSRDREILEGLDSLRTRMRMFPGEFYTCVKELVESKLGKIDPDEEL
jgi:hypothetical protein